MPTHTPAERKRIEKKQRNQSILGYAIFTAVVVLVIIAGDIKGIFKPEQAGEPDFTEAPVDIREQYLGSLGAEDYVIGDEAVRLAFKDGRGEDGQLIVAEKSSMLYVTVRLQYVKEQVQVEATVYPFVGIGTEQPNVTEQPELPSELSKDCAFYLAPLLSTVDNDELASKLDAAVSGAVFGGNSSFISGIYRVTASYSEADGLLSVTAEPAK